MFRANTTRSRRNAVSANTSRLVNAQAKTRSAQTGAEYAQAGRTCSASTQARINATYENGGRCPERAQCGNQVETRGRRRGVLELVRRTTDFGAPACRTCLLVPSSIDHASKKWSNTARTDEREVGCPSTMPRVTALRFRACVGRPCQRPGPFLAPSLPLSHKQTSV